MDGGRFDWMAHADKFPGLCTPDESYHGITYAERFGKEGAFITKCTAQLMRDLGAIQSPQHAFYLNLGLESLHVRMARHCENGQAVAEYLSAHPKVERVIYCGLPGDPYHALAQKYLQMCIRDSSIMYCGKVRICISADHWSCHCCFCLLYTSFHVLCYTVHEA